MHFHFLSRGDNTSLSLVESNPTTFLHYGSSNPTLMGLFCWGRSFHWWTSRTALLLTPLTRWGSCRGGRRTGKWEQESCCVIEVMHEHIIMLSKISIQCQCWIQALPSWAAAWFNHWPEMALWVGKHGRHIYRTNALTGTLGICASNMKMYIR